MFGLIGCYLTWTGLATTGAVLARGAAMAVGELTRGNGRKALNKLAETVVAPAKLAATEIVHTGMTISFEIVSTAAQLLLHNQVLPLPKVRFEWNDHPDKGRGIPDPVDEREVP
jgi:hypothetical protein